MKMRCGMIQFNSILLKVRPFIREVANEFGLNLEDYKMTKANLQLIQLKVLSNR